MEIFLITRQDARARAANLHATAIVVVGRVGLTENASMFTATRVFRFDLALRCQCAMQDHVVTANQFAGGCRAERPPVARH